MSRFRALPAGARIAPGSMPERQAEAKPTAQQRLQALGRLPAGMMNRTEAAYAKLLDDRKIAGDVLWWKFEGVKLRLADGCFLTMDFAVLRQDRVLELVDVKGGAAVFSDDAKVKVKVAAATYPFRFVIAMPRPKKDGGGWSEEAVGG